VLGTVAATGSVKPFPQLQVAAELTFFIVKLDMCGICLLLRLHWAVAHVLHAEGGRNH